MSKHALSRPSSLLRWTVIIVSFTLLIGFGWWWVTNDVQSAEPLPNPVIGNGTPSATVLQETPSVTPELKPKPSKTPKPVLPSTKPFVPERVTVAQIGGRSVQALPRISVGDNGFSLPDPLDANPLEYAWDKEGAQPGSSQGAVNLVAHTYPPGQVALGNQLFDVLQVGDFITLHGASDTLRYQVTERLQVRVADYPQERVLNTDGPPVLTVTICSGERLGPGNWSMRTIWVAKPVK